MPSGGHRPTCTYDGCTRPNAAKGLCQLHYQRWKSSGHPEGGRKVETGATFLEKVTKKFLRGIRKLESGCWTCDTAYKTRAGYLHLQITENGVQHAIKVHRFSYEHFKGPLPKGKLACHTCDVRWCCNPEHLFPGTQSDNMQDMIRKGRGLVGEKNGNTRFKEADILRIYRYLDAGLTRAAIAKRLNVPAVTISQISTGRNWKHLYERHRA